MQRLHGPDVLGREPALHLRPAIHRLVKDDLGLGLPAQCAISPLCPGPRCCSSNCASRSFRAPYTHHELKPRIRPSCIRKYTLPRGPSWRHVSMSVQRTDHLVNWRFVIPLLSTLTKANESTTPTINESEGRKTKKHRTQTGAPNNGPITVLPNSSIAPPLRNQNMRKDQGGGNVLASNSDMVWEAKEREPELRQLMHGRLHFPASFSAVIKSTGVSRSAGDCFVLSISNAYSMPNTARRSPC